MPRFWLSVHPCRFLPCCCRPAVTCPGKGILQRLYPAVLGLLPSLGHRETGVLFFPLWSWGFSLRRAEQPGYTGSFGSAGSHFQVEFLDESKKGKKQQKQVPFLIPPGCWVLPSQGSELPSAPAQPGKASPRPSLRTPNNLGTLLAGQVTPLLPLVLGSAGDPSFTAAPGVSRAGGQPPVPPQPPAVPPGRVFPQGCHLRPGETRPWQGSPGSNRELEQHFQLSSWVLFFFPLSAYP